MRIRFRHTVCFQKTEYMESRARLGNPGCGWYHIYTFVAGPFPENSSVEEEIWMDDACREEQLALVLIDIGAFRTREMTKEAIRYISQILDFFHRNQKQMILRFVYDREGKGMTKEPLTLSMVKRHMEQAGEIVRAYGEDILVMQGIFVGNWGEMHGSKFLDDNSLCELVNTLYRTTKGACFLAVRTPAQWRRIADSGRAGAGLLKRLGLFNDGMFGSETDLGTYGAGNREEELAWQKSHLASVPNGGEALVDTHPEGWLKAAAEMRKMHISYLNSIYHPDQLEHWKKETVEEEGCWAGASGYDYIGMHLGYRFVIRDVEEGKHKELCIRIENCGFANLCQEADCFLETETGEGQVVGRRLDTDPREWRSGETILLPTGLFPKGKYGAGSRVYLKLKRRSDGRNILFANRNAEERIQIGEFVDV